MKKLITAPPTLADAAPSWQSGKAWIAGDHLHLPMAAPIPLSQIDNILIIDASYRKTPTWAVVLGVLGIFFFLIGLLFFLVKETVPSTRITVYVKGHLATPISLSSPATVGYTEAEWYPVLAAVKGRS